MTASHRPIPIPQVIPFALEAKLKLVIEYSIKASAGYATGEKVAQFRLYGHPLDPETDFDMIKDEKPTTNGLDVVTITSDVEDSFSV